MSKQRPTAYHDPSAPTLIPVDDCETYDTGYRPNLPGQRTWWVFCPVTGLFANKYTLLGAMIESVARGQASLAPNWDRTYAGGIWYDFDCSAELLDAQLLMGAAIAVRVEFGRVTREDWEFEIEKAGAESSPGRPRRDAPIQDILQGILDENLTLHYARWEHYSDAKGGGRYQGPLLELAYWIGSEIGTLGSDATKYQQRDKDKWVVLHFHFQNHPSTFHHRKGQDTLFNLRRITGYHGRTVKRHSRISDSRVHGEYSHRFTVLKCENEEDWFVGCMETQSQTQTPATVQGCPYAAQLCRLVQQLYDRGYLAKQAFRLPYPVEKGREQRNPFVAWNYHADGESMCRNFLMVEKELGPGWTEWEVERIGDIHMCDQRR
ncbi:hypothetical protein CNMCM5793_006115 [Aspergillus hiratsukae]|uniref:Uncharacterized protein n=1 Tax=Aspergillus hiratsukae TaxID=1194566 RepID=A0A8H6UAN9_9EURO|nr:hypothetical protein CNMCM5793_006115 [Aspergillus hiratsukae]KAF7167286.1 hypothetical protein CNMCM6106_002889 [Aspergillus hiratsukae]